jgi:hypothetical protein
VTAAGPQAGRQTPRELRRAGNPVLLTPSNARSMTRVPAGVVQAGAVREFARTRFR